MRITLLVRFLRGSIPGAKYLNSLPPQTLDTELTIEFVQNDSGLNGEIYAHFDYQFSGFTIPPGGTANSGNVPNVLLTKGALGSLPIIPLQTLDVANAITVSVGGYTVPWLQYSEKGCVNCLTSC